MRAVGGALAVIALFAVGSTAFTAATTPPPGPAGEGVAATISGFTISNIAYHLDGTDPTLIESVTFTAQSAAGPGWPASLTTSVARFTTIAAAWYVCSDDAGGAAAGTYAISCRTAGGGLFYDGVTAETQLTMLANVQFDTILVQ